jgi:outer membrane protein TolC
MRFAIVGLALLLGSLVTTASAAPLTLEQAVSRALEQSEEVQLTQAQLLDARGQVREALSTALPQVNGSVTYRHQIDSIFEGFAADTGLGKVFSNSSFGAVRDWTIGLEASQLLFDGGKWLAGMRGAKLYLRAATEQNREAISDLVYRVKSAYYQASAAQRLLAIAEGSLDQARKHEAQVALFHQQGTRAEYDLLRAQVDAANQEPGVVSARTAADLALLRLKQLINWRGADALELATPLESTDGTVPVPEALALDTKSRGALAASQANVGLQEQAVRAARASRWPSLTASTNLQHQAFPQGGEWPERSEFLRNWDAEIKLSLPIFTGLRTGAEIQRARAALTRAKAERDQAAEQVAFEAADAKARLDQAAAQLGARRETVRQATRAYELSEIRYTNGISTQLEVSDARLGMQTAQVNQIDAARDYLVALAGLERALGRPVPVVRKPLESLTLSMNAEAKPR